MIHPFGPDDAADENRGSDRSGPPGGNDARGFDAGGFRARLNDVRGYEARGYDTPAGDAPGKGHGGAAGGTPGERPSGAASSAGDGPFDELGLRRLLHDAVRDITPQADALERLHRAVPARRARRRQAMVGAAAGVLLIGTAIPAVLHAASTAGTDSSTAASSSASQGHGSAPGVEGGTEQGGGASGPAGRGANGRSGAGTTGGVQPSASSSALASNAGPTGTAAAAPACTRAQLGRGSAQVGNPDAGGRIYGSFLVVNVSSSDCSIPGEGQITVTGQGGVDPSRIQVVDHTAGDPATGLPDPATVPAGLVLAPGKAYQVQFAWIPASSGSTGCAPGGTGSTTGSSGGMDGSTGSGGSGSTTSTTTANMPGAAGSPSATAAPSGITLTHVPEEGDPSAATATIAGACAGTVYRTAVLAAP